MLISKIAMVRWNGFTRKWYEGKGYIWTKVNDYFECKIEDVQINSTVRIEVKCDYCGEIFYPEYRQFLDARKTINKDCCKNRKCMTTKTKEVNMIKFGVESYMKLASSKIYFREMNQTPFKEVKMYFEEKELELLSNESDYENDRSRLFFVCKHHKKHGIQETDFANVKRIKGCCIYGKGEICAESRKLDGKIVYQAFIDKGIFPQFNPKDYKKNNQQLPFICPDHKEKGIQYKNYSTLLASPHKCYYCSKEFTKESLRIDKNIIIDLFLLKGIIPENINEYENKDIPINFRCQIHPNYIQKISYNGIKNTKVPCEHCRIENSLTKLNKRLRSSLHKWRTKSIKSCNNKCIFTGESSFDIHHLYPYNLIIKESLNILNIDIKDVYSPEEYIDIKKLVIELHNKYPLGVCISNRIHVIFHQLYSKTASIDDFYEFKERYESGEFNKLLEEVS